MAGIRWLVALLISPAGPACRIDPMAALHDAAAESFQCRPDALKVAQLGDTGLRTVTGCGHEAMFYWNNGQWIEMPDLRKRAAFDLKCPNETLELTAISDNTVGVAGSAHQATYVFTPVAGTRSVLQYDWVMNTATEKH